MTTKTKTRNGTAPTADPAAAPWKNRIVGSGTEDPSQLLANPANWRLHPKAQQDALRGSLDTVGWVQQVMVNQRTGFVVDGHARVEEALTRHEPTVPVLYVDLSPEEEAIVLATLDPIGAMADRDRAKLDALLAEITVDDAGLRALLVDLAGTKRGLVDPVEGAFGLDPGADMDVAEDGGHMTGTPVDGCARDQDDAAGAVLFHDGEWRQRRDDAVDVVPLDGDQAGSQDAAAERTLGLDPGADGHVSGRAGQAVRQTVDGGRGNSDRAARAVRSEDGQRGGRLGCDSAIHIGAGGVGRGRSRRDGIRRDHGEDEGEP